MKLSDTGSNLFGSREVALQMLTLTMNQKEFSSGGWMKKASWAWILQHPVAKGEKSLPQAIEEPESL